LIRRILLVGAIMSAALIGIAGPLAAAKLSADVLTVKGLSSPGAPQFTWCSTSGTCIAVGTGTTKASSAVVYEITTSNGRELSSSFDAMPSNYAAGVSGAGAYISSLSCVNSSSCLVVGNYSVTAENLGVFTWQLNQGSWTGVTQLTGFANQYTPQVEEEHAACWGPGDCFVTGDYSAELDGAQNWQGFSDVEANGTFGPVTLLTEPNTPGAEGDDEVDAFACSLTDPGWCETLSTYTVNSVRELFATSFLDGVEQTATPVSAPSDYVGTTQPIAASTLSCWTEYSCIAAGTYVSTDATTHEWRVVQTPSGWGDAAQEPVPVGYDQSNVTAGYFPPTSACAVNGTCVLSSWATPTSQSKKLDTLLNAFVNGAFTASFVPDPAAGIDVSDLACGAGTCSVFENEGALHAGRNISILDESARGTFSKPDLVQAYPTNMAKRNGDPSITSAWCNVDNVCTASAFYVTSKNADGIFQLFGLR
jgi:hypothetical protein